MTTWVRMNDLNVEYFKVDFMEKIRNLISNIMKVDPHTMSQARGKFTRVCVELDMSKPLTLFIKVEGRTYGVVYEGIQLVCFECGFYGHGRDTCPIIIKVKAQATDTVVVENMGVITRVTVDDLNVDHPTRTDADNPAKKHGE